MNSTPSETTSANWRQLAENVGHRIAAFPFHPFAFAALPIVASLSEVKKLVLPEEIIPSLIIAEVFALILLVVASLVLRSLSKGAIIATLAIGLLFSYRLLAYAMDAALKSISGQSPPAWLLLLIYSFLCLVALAASLKTKWDFGKLAFELDHERLSGGLNLICGLLLCFNVFTLLQFEIEDESVTQKFVTAFKTAFDGAKLNEAAEKPDVYYFIIDGFANRLTMREFCNTKDDRLYDFLKSRGFYLVERAASNYDRTEFSLSSTFSMQYIDRIPDALGKKYDHLNLFCRVIQDSAVLRMFKRLGYTFVNMSSGTSATDMMYTADKNIRCSPFNHFVNAMALLTPLYATEPYYPMMRNILADMRICPGHCLDKLVNIPGPKFVLIHTDLAHAPCLFDEHGGALPLPPGQYMINWGTPQELGAQWKFAQTVLIEWLTKLFEMTHGKAIIIVQSDHGSGIPFAKTEDWFNERMRIWNAIYLPGKNNAGCYATMTPVNSFRVLFDDYFQAQLPMLPDKVWCPPDYNKPFDWIEIRDKLKFDH